MERGGFSVPLLIGGATTSAKSHTAVEDEPNLHNHGRRSKFADRGAAP